MILIFWSINTAIHFWDKFSLKNKQVEMHKKQIINDQFYRNLKVLQNFKISWV